MFKDRFDAARQLVLHVQEYRNKPGTIIIAIPRGGIQLGYVLAKELSLPLDVMFTKKIGHPENQEYAIGAVSEHHVMLNEQFNVPSLQPYIHEQIETIRQLLRQRTLQYRGQQQPLDLTDKTVIVVDDGVATGSTLMATLLLIKQEKPEKVIIALPVAPAETLERLRQEVDNVICLETPSPFYGVGQAYQQFEQVDDKEAIKLLHEANQ